MGNNNPLVSIVVITYNSSKYVLETLESAKAQTYQNIELIVSDDCSTDNTIEICRNWIEENKDRFVRTELITVEKNTGIAPNCNRGCKKAQGEWVKLIAGDDILLDSCIADNIDYVKNNSEINILFSDKYSFYLNDVLPEKNMIDTIKVKMPLVYQYSAEEQLNSLVNGHCFVYAPTTFVKKELLDTFGYYDENYPFLEDCPMWIKLTKNGIKLFFMPKITVLYRRGNTITTLSGEFMNIQHYYSCTKFIKYLLVNHKFYGMSFIKRLNYNNELFRLYVGVILMKNRRNKVNSWILNMIGKIDILNMKKTIDYRVKLLKIIFKS